MGDIRSFNPKMDYNTTLTHLKEEFNKKWDLNQPSPDTNLDGYDEVAILGEGSFGKVVGLKIVDAN